MNPFLAGLVERATLRAPMLERRPRSLFEPVAGAVNGPVATDGAAQTAADDLDSLVDRPRIPEERDDSASPSLGDPETGDGPVARLIRLERSTVETLHYSDKLEARPSSFARHVGDEPRPVHSTAPRHNKPEPVARVDTPVAATLLVERPLRTRLQTALSARSSAQPYPLARFDDLENYPSHDRSALVAADGSAVAVPAPIPTGTPLPGTNALLRSGPRIPGPSVSVVRAHAGPRAPQPHDVVTTPAPVHVTIGRIEVRASAPADRPPAHRPPAGPRLSLDAYLNGRRGGSR